MYQAILGVLLASATAAGGTAAQSERTAGIAPRVLATVRIPVTVGAGEALLAPGAYELRLTGQRPAPLAGQPPDAQEWIEFVSEGRVVARDVAEVLHDDDLTPVGASSQPVRPGTRVEMLEGGEFLRISVKRGGERYLIYLPVRE